MFLAFYTRASRVFSLSTHVELIGEVEIIDWRFLKRIGISEITHFCFICVEDFDYLLVSNYKNSEHKFEILKHPNYILLRSNHYWF